MEDVTPIKHDYVELSKKTIQRRRIRRRPATNFVPDVALDYTAEQTVSIAKTSVPAKQLRRLSNAKLPIDQSVDLHGLSSHQSLVYLHQAIEESVDKQHRCIRIIHGKGLAFMKNLVCQELQSHASVLAYCSAPARLGGTGSLMVLLQRKKEQ